MTLTTTPIDAAATHRIRRAVLRNGDLAASVEWDHDDAATTLHLGAFLGGDLVAVSTWIDAIFDQAPAEPARQLRGMATTPEVTGRGIGFLLLAAGCEHAAAVGASIVWANARVTALGFYERAGFTVTGPVFATPATGLPHRLIHRRL